MLIILESIIKPQDLKRKLEPKRRIKAFYKNHALQQPTFSISGLKHRSLGAPLSPSDSQQGLENLVDPRRPFTIKKNNDDSGSRRCISDLHCRNSLPCEAQPFLPNGQNVFTSRLSEMATQESLPDCKGLHRLDAWNNHIERRLAW